MRITKIETRKLTAALKTPFQTALRRVEFLKDLVVIIHTDSELKGYGEGAPTPVITGETMGTMQAVIDYLAPFLIGREIDDFESLIDIVQHRILKNTTAKSALEIALYDLKAKSQNLPLYRMLGGKERNFQTDITISLNETVKMVSDSLEAIERGYAILKIKVGDGVRKDIERIQAISEAAGENILLRLDANQGWTAKESVEILTVLERRGIELELLEQPVKADNIEGLRYIKDRVKTPILADESVFTLGDAKRLLDLQAVDLINIKLAKCGGISNALKLANIADEYGVKCMLGCMLEGPISVGAGVHVASAKANVITMLDLDAVSLCRNNPVAGGVIFDESKMIIPESAGLGVEY
ncbi:MAG: dipeptide epimerase [Campylobacterota bacterium]|nr:dipeptide epimerase [Campylobacterota bacterium]